MLTQPNPRDCRWMSMNAMKRRQTESRTQKSISNTQKDKHWVKYCAMKQMNMNYTLTQYFAIPTSKPPWNKWEFSLQKGIQAIHVAEFYWVKAPNPRTEQIWQQILQRPYSCIMNRFTCKGNTCITNLGCVALRNRTDFLPGKSRFDGRKVIKKPKPQKDTNKRKQILCSWVGLLVNPAGLSFHSSFGLNHDNAALGASCREETVSTCISHDILHW